MEIQKQNVKCSQSNFITKSLVEKLNLPTRKIKVPICGIDQIKTTISEETYICLSSKQMEFKTKIQCLVIEKITDFSPQESFEISLNIPEVPLADPEFNLARRIDILIGCSLFFDLLLSGHIKLGNGLTTLQNSKLGWIVAGDVPKVQRKSHNFLLLSEEDSLKALMERFWRIEEISKEKNCLLSSEEKECEAHFQKTISRNSEGRFIVKLSLKENLWELGNSEHLALKRLYSLEQRLSKNRGLKEEYTKFLKEYESLSHMREISRNETCITPIYYLPHHCVIKPESSTTKLRVVFKASAKTTSNISLKDVLMDGPVLQNDLFSILTRFRKHEVVLIGDLTKMYRQILIHPDHVNLQRIVWRENPNQKVNPLQPRGNLSCHGAFDYILCARA
ncbi:uncharacterized protein LOC123675453 [Harmonia axyridis]|uniref:uncharacterized protein LOC123675453 n=1 Tax=Harmonia axyridis TaxID=115357 RepID=UPI001E277E1E|nr:uncharacterized protein LOC123675453 [Harmonia axyridis]